MKRSNLISKLVTVLLFLFLETISVVMVSRGGIVQRYRITGALRNVQTGLWKTKSDVGYYLNYKKENEKLFQENIALKNELELYKSLVVDDDSVRTTPAPGFSYIPAMVINNSTNRQHNNILLNKGKDDGISEGMGVITSNGIVGVINSVSRHYAHVISFLSEGQSVSAMIKADGTFGPMVWQGKSPHEALLYEIPASCEVHEGDTITSSGYSIIYPADIPLGVISHSSSDGVTLEIKVDLFQNFKSLKHVYVVKNNNYEEIKGLQDGE